MGKSKIWAEEIEFDPGSSANIAILVAVLVTFISAAVVPDPALTLPVWVVLITLGILHLVLYFPLHRMFLDHKSDGRKLLYFALQLALVAAMHGIGAGRFWLLFMPLASQSVFVFRRPAQIAFFLIIVALFLLPVAKGNLVYAAQYGLIFFSALVFVLIFSEVAIRERRIHIEKDRIARELEVANRRLQEAAAQAEELARSRERNRLAREIHDSLGHYLTVVNVQLEAAKALLAAHGWQETAPELAAALEKAQTLTRNGLEDVRRSVASLRVNVLPDRPLPEALRGLIEESQAAGLVSHLIMEGTARALPPQHELTLFRAAQEGLTNIRKHARASKADLLLQYSPDCTSLTIIDNGIGISNEAELPTRGFGLLGLRERAELLHGTFSIFSNPEGGTTLTIALPAMA